MPIIIGINTNALMWSFAESSLTCQFAFHRSDAISFRADAENSITVDSTLRNQSWTRMAHSLYFLCSQSVPAFISLIYIPLSGFIIAWSPHSTGKILCWWKKLDENHVQDMWRVIPFTYPEHEKVLSEYSHVHPVTYWIGEFASHLVFLRNW